MVKNALIDADLRPFTGPGPQHSGDGSYIYWGTQYCRCTEGTCRYLANCREGLKPFDTGYINDDQGRRDDWEPEGPTRCDRCGEPAESRACKVQCRSCGNARDCADP